MMENTFELWPRSIIAQFIHGNSAIRFRNRQWEQVTTEVNFAETLTDKFVSLGYSSERERLFLDLKSPRFVALCQQIEEKCIGKTTLEILSIISNKINQLQKNKTSDEAMEAQFNRYLTERKQGRILGKPANGDILIDELMEKGHLLCRHKGILAASIMGRLVHKKILPPGMARQYRSEIQDSKGFNMGVHTWSVYREWQTGNLWILDPHWNLIQKLNKDFIKANPYGIKAINQMLYRMDKIDELQCSLFSLKAALELVFPGVVTLNKGTQTHSEKQVRVEFKDYLTNPESKLKYHLLKKFLIKQALVYSEGFHGTCPFIIIREQDKAEKINQQHFIALKVVISTRFSKPNNTPPIPHCKNNQFLFKILGR